MGNKTRIQCNERKGREQWYINVPSAVAEAMELMAGETVEWIIEDRDTLVIRRLENVFPVTKKNPSSITRLF
jgi:bifunctional DNA-binding transcriptional regulator/antitoxin component of YhaV-PrlF toxin-antitoxin module